MRKRSALTLATALSSFFASVMGGDRFVRIKAAPMPMMKNDAAHGASLKIPLMTGISSLSTLFIA